MEHTSTICNMIDKPKHLKSAFIHEVEKPTTMKMSIWNAHQMARRQELLKNATIEDFNKPPKAEYVNEDQCKQIQAVWMPNPSSWKVPHSARMLKPSIIRPYCQKCPITPRNIPTDRSGNCKNNLGVQISKSTLKPCRSELLH